MLIFVPLFKGYQLSLECVRAATEMAGFFLKNLMVNGRERAIVPFALTALISVIYLGWA